MVADTAGMDRRQRAMDIALAGSALVALLIGVSIYVLDRDWASTLFLAPFSAWQLEGTGTFGPLGYLLPSFLHAYAFALLIGVALRPMRNAATAGALGWFAIAATFEFMQAESFHGLALDTNGYTPGWLLIDSVQAYVVHGCFDAGDLWATASGCFTACVIATLSEIQR